MITNMSLNLKTKEINNMSDTSFKYTIDDKEVTFDVKALTAADQREAQKIYNQAFSDAVKSGSMVRARLDDLLKEQGLWDDNKQQKYLTMQKELSDNDRSLSKGGISLKAAKRLAIRMKELRVELRELISVKTNLDSHTAEGQADNARFNYLVFATVVYKDTQKRYYESYEAYLNKSSDAIGIVAAQKVAFIMYGLDSDYEQKLPENKFLLKYKLVNNQLEYIDSAGRLVDTDDKLVDKNGRYINDKGEFIDVNGNLVDLEGEYIVDFQPFVDEDGKPIVVEDTTEKVVAEVVEESVEAETVEVEAVIAADTEEPNVKTTATKKPKTITKSA